MFDRYQTMATFLRDRCDSEQVVDPGRLDEHWMVGQMLHFLDRWHRTRTHHPDKFSPEEFKTGRPGGARRVDVVSYSKRGTTGGHASLLAEAKLMTEANRPWAKEVLSDLFRVACVRKQTTSKTHRLVVVVGQERCWQLTQDQCGGLLGRLCPMNRRSVPVLAKLPGVRWQKTLDDRWKAANKGHFEGYLLPHLPATIRVELVGLSRSQRDPDEQPDLGMTARVWRVYPRGVSRDGGG